MHATETELIDAIRARGYRPNPAGQSGRACVLESVRGEHPDAKIVVVRDEYTGRRFGLSKCNAGRCWKLGHNSSTPHGRGWNCYQVWARW